MSLSSPENQASPNPRLFAPDALRGLIIILMALDHANFFVAQRHSSGEYWGGPLPVYENTADFIARLVTHPAAPGFFFLMGIGMALTARSQAQKGRTKWQVTRGFLLRGLMLIALQLLVVNRAWELAPRGWGLDIYIGVLVALGGGMILGSGLVWLRTPILLGLAVVFILVMELLTPSPNQWGQAFPLLYNLLIAPGGQASFWVNYPVLQWLELIVLGMVFGNWFAEDARKALRRSLVIGAIFLSLFIIVRALNGFGNIRPLEGHSWVNVFNLVKYPPSLAFTFLTMGFNLLVLGGFGWLVEKFPKARVIFQPLEVFGRVPLFFYVLHLFLYALLGYLFTPSGSSIAVMLLYWLLGLLILYPLCLGYGRWKRTLPANSVWRFF